MTSVKCNWINCHHNNESENTPAMELVGKGYGYCQCEEITLSDTLGNDTIVCENYEGAG